MTHSITATDENTAIFCSAINSYVDIEKLYNTQNTDSDNQPANINREMNSVLKQLYTYRALKKTGQL